MMIQQEARAGRKAELWITVPTLNEAENVTPLLERIQREMNGFAHSVCIVDDGSRDGTVERIRDFVRARSLDNIHILQREKKHLGSQRGAAVTAGLRLGLEQSRADVFVEMDADLSHAPEELKAGIEAIRSGGYNVAIASKYLPASRVVNRPFSRRVLSFLANGLVRTLISRNVRDYSNGFRFYDRASVEAICAHRLRYGSPIYLSEVLAVLLARRARVLELPTTYLGRGEGLSKLRWTDLLKAGIAVLDIAARFHLNVLSPEAVAAAQTPPRRPAPSKATEQSTIKPEQ